MVSILNSSFICVVANHQPPFPCPLVCCHLQLIFIISSWSFRHSVLVSPVYDAVAFSLRGERNHQTSQLLRSLVIPCLTSCLVQLSACSRVLLLPLSMLGIVSHSSLEHLLVASLSLTCFFRGTRSSSWSAIARLRLAGAGATTGAGDLMMLVVCEVLERRGSLATI